MLVSFCCVTTYKHSSLRYHKYIPAQFLEVRRLVIVWLDLLPRVSLGWNCGVSQGCGYHLGSESSSELTGCWQDSFPCSCRTQVSRGHSASMGSDLPRGLCRCLLSSRPGGGHLSHFLFWEQPEKTVFVRLMWLSQAHLDNLPITIKSADLGLDKHLQNPFTAVPSSVLLNEPRRCRYTRHQKSRRAIFRFCISKVLQMP